MWWQRQGQSENLQIFSKALAALFFFHFTLLIAVPGTIYFANLEEFSIDYSVFLLFAVPLTAISTVALAGLCVWLPAKINLKVIALVLAISLLLWLEANVIVWKYGQFDGHTINWASHFVYGIIDTPIWIAVIVVASLKPNLFNKYSQSAAITFVAIQIVSLGFSSLSASYTSQSAAIKNTIIDQSDKFAFSSKNNIILIVLDEYQGDIFDAIIDADVSYKHLFEGFVYFENATSASNYTEIAIPALLTGTVYDNATPKSQYLLDSFRNESLPKVLKDNDFAVHLFPWVGWGNESILFGEEIATNFISTDSDSATRPVFVEKNVKEVLHLFELSLFRSLPHFLKPLIFDANGWIVSRLVSKFAPASLKAAASTDSAFETDTLVEGAKRGIRTDLDRKTFKYYHTKGVHRPLVVNEQLEYGSEVFEYSRETYFQQAKANLVYLGELFDLLRKNNIFDNSMIVIVGDHGSGNTPDMYILPTDEPVTVSAGVEITPPTNFQRNKAKGIPLILVKRPGGSGELETSRAPVSTLDVKSTILTEFGLAVDGESRSMFDFSEHEHRTRHYSAIKFGPEKRDFIPPITVYSINGHSWLDSSWTVTDIQKRMD